MSMKWPGGLIRKTPVTPAGPLQNGAAPGMWTLAEASYWTKQGLWPIAGNTLVVEDVFQTWLYTGTSATQTITNSINVSGSGGLVWIKPRDSGLGHNFFDTIRGPLMRMQSDNTDASTTVNNSLTGFTSSGFTLGSAGGTNNSGTTFASWTFREAPNFFDVVTYTGTGANQNIAHNLGSVPGMILVKRTDTAANWQVYHTETGNTRFTVLNTTAAEATGATRWNNTTPTSSVFTVGTDATVNASGGTYVAYLFAHNTASDGLIQCGVYIGNGSATGPTVTLGWEPQWLMIKRVNSTGNWQIIDNMRGMPVGSADATLQANLTNIESAVDYVSPTATGFQLTSTSAEVNASSSVYIYMAIRRGPMRTPTLGTSVFAPVATNSTNNPQTGFPLDLWWLKARDGVELHVIMDRMRQTGKYLSSDSTAAEANNPANYYRIDNMTGGFSNGGTFPQYIHWCLRRAPSFFDVVCYTGTGAARTVTHNLGVAPELIITKSRSNGTLSWNTYAAPLGNSASVRLNTTDAAFGGYWNSTSPTSTVFSLSSAQQVNENGSTYVAYLFASAPGVSKVGSYTGNGSSQTINCAFTTGARFVLIKRTDSTGDWYVWDSARGIVAGNDPYLLLNSTAAEVTGTNYVDTDTTGFKVTAAAPAGINANGGTYIFLAIA